MAKMYWKTNQALVTDSSPKIHVTPRSGQRITDALMARLEKQNRAG